MSAPVRGGSLDVMENDPIANTDIPTAAGRPTGSATTGGAGPASAAFAVPPALPPAAPAAPAAPARFALRRSRTDRILGGVCGGLAASLGTDAALLRVLVVTLTLITGGAAAIVYVAAWALAPEEDGPAS